MGEQWFLFFKRCFGWGALLMGTFGLCTLLGPPITSVDLVGALVAKHKRLASAPSPRIIIIGGSNTMFGVNSPLLEKATGRSVVNMGLHASLGYGFMCRELDGALRPGDIVLAMPEHSQYAKPEKLEIILYSAMDLYPGTLGHIPAIKRPQLLLNYAVLKTQRCWKEVTGKRRTSGDPIYRASGFNAQGDMIAHEGLASRGIDRERRIRAINIDPVFWQLTDALEQEVTRAGAELVFALPAMPLSLSVAAHDSLIVASLQQHGYAVLDNVDQRTFKNSDFFDSKYHLMPAARDERTRWLVKALSQRRSRR